MTRLSKTRTHAAFSRKGMGTVEIVIIIAVLVALALIFREGLMEFANKVMNYCFDDSKITTALS
ncbi:Putative Flagellin, Flp1-like, domain [Ruminococcaceae bacterium YRB3002]|nr:Putative Flagellin, Flp1-like, domain [Ruminococcaceae bacterium YRB3002]